MKALRIVLLGAGMVLALSACSADQVGASMRSWCKSASNCDDHSRQTP